MREREEEGVRDREGPWVEVDRGEGDSEADRERGKLWRERDLPQRWI